MSKICRRRQGRMEYLFERVAPTNTTAKAEGSSACITANRTCKKKKPRETLPPIKSNNFETQ